MSGMKRAVPALLAMLFLLPGAATAAGRTYALLVGVSQYPALDPGMWLEGPHNDVELFSEFVQARGVAKSDMTVLADGVPGAGEPTKKAIIAGLDSIAARAQPGDVAFLMFAGHGSQQPAKADDLKNETDGLDEIFLPRDVGKWDGEIAALPNALTDNELGAAIGRIRDRGVFVWAVFDNCHSGTITRAMPLPGEKDRQVRPEALGIDPKVLAAAATAGAAASERTRGGPAPAVVPSSIAGVGARSAGNSSRSSRHRARRRRPRLRCRSTRRRRSARTLFLHALPGALDHPDATYRQAIEQVLQSYQGMGRQQPTPTYEGNGLDNIVFGATPGNSIAQWRVDNDAGALRLRAGAIQLVTRTRSSPSCPIPRRRTARSSATSR